MDFNDIYKKYYGLILNFSYAKLGSRQLAEECTQEVFLAFSRKMHSLTLDSNIAAWLYTAAKFEIKRCIQKKDDTIPIEKVEDALTEPIEPNRIFDDILTEDEYATLSDFYVNGEDIKKLSEKEKISPTAMYRRINRLKQKVIQNSDKLHNLLHK